MESPNRYTCEKVYRRLDDYLDRELTADEMRLVREHLEVCAACARQHRFEFQVLEDIRSKLRHIAVPHDLAAKVDSLLERLARQSHDGKKKD